MKNEYEVRGDVTAIIINSPKYGRIETLIDTAELERVKQISGSWSAQWSPNTKSFYAINSLRVDNVRKRIHLHRCITDTCSELVVDHINHDTLDNRIVNLRQITQAQNLQNKKGPSKNNKSTGVRGVVKSTKHKKYIVKINHEGKTKHIGLYSDLEDAKKAYETARAKYFPFSHEAMNGKVPNL